RSALRENFSSVGRVRRCCCQHPPPLETARARFHACSLRLANASRVGGGAVGLPCKGFPRRSLNLAKRLPSRVTSWAPSGIGLVYVGSKRAATVGTPSVRSPRRRFPFLRGGREATAKG